MFYNIYALTDLASGIHLWDHIRYVWSLAPLFPWIVVGYFNDILILDEKRGGLYRLESSSAVFRNNIALLNLIDIKPLNGIFTCSNKRCGKNSISERLDRLLVSSFLIGNKWISGLKFFEWRGLDH